MHNRSILLLILCALLWSSGGIFIKSTELSGLTIAGLRSLVAAVLFWFYIRKPKFLWDRYQIGSVISYSATVILFVAATKLTTAANAIFLQYTAPIYVALLSYWFLGEKITKSDWFFIALTLSGMTLFFIDNLSANYLLGNGLALLSGVSFAWFALFIKKQKGVSLTESILAGNILTTLICLPFYYDIVSSDLYAYFSRLVFDHFSEVFAEGFSNYTSTHFHLTPAISQNIFNTIINEIRPQGPSHFTDYLQILAMGVFQLGIPYLLYTKAALHLSALELILIPAIEPVLNPIWVAIFYGEKPSFVAVIGGLIVISAVTLRSILRMKKSRRNSVT